MSERYKMVKLYDNFSFSPSCPIDILKGAIYIDTVTNNTVFQLKFINTQNKNIKALYISVDGYDELGQKLENKEYQYLDLNVDEGQEFGTEQLKQLKNNTIRHIEIIISKVIYTDNEIWKNTDEVYYERKKLQEIDNNLILIAKKKTTEMNLKLDDIYYPFQYKHYWNCICGTFNSNEKNKCYKCNCDRKNILNNFNKKTLEKELKDYKEQENKNKKIKIKKMKKVAFIVIPIIFILLIVWFFYIIEHNKLIQYNEAIDKYNNMQYDEAISLLEKLEGYKDTTTYISMANNEKEDLEIIKKCLNYYNEESKYFYNECKKMGEKIQHKQTEQYISQLKNYGYYNIISTIYTLREKYIQQLDDLKTEKFIKDKEKILIIDNNYTELYNFCIAYPTQDNYTDYINEAYKFYSIIENNINDIENKN